MKKGKKTGCKIFLAFEKYNVSLKQTYVVSGGIDRNRNFFHKKFILKTM